MLHNFPSQLRPHFGHARPEFVDRLTVILIWSVIALAAVYFLGLYLVSTA